MKIRYFIFIILLFLGNLYSKGLACRKTKGNFYNYTRADSVHSFDVEKYVLNLDIDSENEFIEASVEAFVVAVEEISEIKYELEGLTVSSVLVNGNSADFSHEDGIITIQTGDLEAQEEFVTKVFYEGNPGLSSAPYVLGMFFNSNLIYTISDPNASRFWWPCYDHPWDKAVVDLHVTLREDWLAACNGIRTEMENNGDGTITHHWLGENPMATYLVSICCSDYVELNAVHNGIPLQNFVSAGQSEEGEEIFSTLPDMLDVFSEKIAEYPFEKYGNAVASISTFGAMEHQTMTTLGSSFFSNTQSGQLTIAHELFHQWFGNSLTPLTWKDVWLSEGFATYSEYIYLRSWSGNEAAYQYMKGSIHNYYKNWLSSNGPHSCYNPSLYNTFCALTYEKPASVIHMLRLKLGEEDFWNGIQQYFETFKNSNVVTEDFKNSMETASGEDLEQFFEQWIYGTGIPSLNLLYFISDELGQIRTVVKTYSETETSFEMEIPLMIETETGIDSVLVRANEDGFVETKDISGNFVDLEFDPHNWLLISSFENILPSFSNYYVADGKVFLQWNDYSEITDIAGYRLYRANSSDGDYELVTEDLISTNSYIDDSVSNNETYYYKVSAAYDEDFRTKKSDYIEANPVEFSLDQGVLVIDETYNGNGTPQSPNDEMADSFYETIIPAQTTRWDFDENGVPSLEYMGKFSTIIWHDDDFNSNNIGEGLFNLGCYSLAGGNVIISGWRTIENIGTDFTEYFFDDLNSGLINLPLFQYASSETYADLYVNPDKWDGMLPLIQYFENYENSIYSYQSEEECQYTGKSVAIKSENNGNIVLLGFPLYYIEDADAESFLISLLSEFNEELGANEDNEINKFSLDLYPNPLVQGFLKIDVKGSRNLKIKSVQIFNVKGQKVKEFNDIRGTEIKWDGKDSFNQELSSGMYLVKVKSDDFQEIKKVLLIK